MIRRRLGRLRADERGMATAEYAVGTVAAAGFAGILWKILTSSLVRHLVESLIAHALNINF